MGETVYLVNDRRIRVWVPFLFLMLVNQTVSGAEHPTIHQQLEVWLQPDRLRVEALVELPEKPTNRVLELSLGSDFEVEILDAYVVSDRRMGDSGMRLYRVQLPPDASRFRLRYSGRLATPGETRRSAMPRRAFDAEGIYLDGSSGWYPRFGGALFTVQLTVHHSESWRVVSQGALNEVVHQRTTWSTRVPQDDLYLIAGPYHYYERAGRTATAQVFLLGDDRDLAERYLGITEHYLDLYSRLLGPYPFAKFAAVENRWETGFGMPSFTLLGRRVMRLPFILTSSYPHEIVHNWLGNSVYPDYANGNWSEGLTTYLADHLIQEQQGGGARYRRGALQKYADYVSSESDFPLREFRSRHDGATQAVGYGKTMMLFHMLRKRMGDEQFREALRELTGTYRFKTVGFDGIRALFERVSGQRLKGFFDQWVERTGAPELSLTGIAVTETKDGTYRMEGEIRQIQKGNAYQLDIPVALTLLDRSVQLERITMDGKEAKFSFISPFRPQRLDIDPRFDLFRRLADSELPPSLGQLFGAPSLLVVLPARADPETRAAYRKMAGAWRQRFPNLVIQDDSDPLPESGGIWILGEQNRHAARVRELLTAHYGMGDLKDSRLPGEEGRAIPDPRSVVVTVRQNGNSTLGWLLPRDANAIEPLARKLPHYGKYSFLTFVDDSVRNVTKGEWPVLNSPLTHVFSADRSVALGELPAEIPLIQ